MKRSLMTILSLFIITSTTQAATPVADAILVRSNSKALCIVIQQSQVTVYQSNGVLGVSRLMGPVKVSQNREYKGLLQIVSGDKSFEYVELVPGSQSPNEVYVTDERANQYTFDYIERASKCPFNIANVSN